MGFPDADAHLALLLLLDIRAAFPSVAHAWLRRVLSWMQLPPVFIRVFEALLTYVFALVDVGGSMRTAFAVGGGVVQGCPMSATLFLFTFEPFLYALYHLIDAAGVGLSRACAGDVACLLRRIQHLRSVFAIFRSAEIIANLSIQPTKCILVPVGRGCGLATIAMVKQFLADLVPSWMTFQISGAGVYLGLQIGPDAHAMAWPSTVLKLVNRVASIAGLLASELRRAT